jgi:D-glycero-D-manno-heptose 1,7-bisphosphate phosphatase
MSGPAAIVFDRDGVLNELWHEPDLGTVDSPLRPDQVVLTERAAAAVRLANEAGVPCVVASNQPGVAKGKMTRELLASVTRRLLSGLAGHGARIDAVYYCLHHPDAVVPALRGECPNRKPHPGLLLRAARRLGADPADCWFVGDTARDVAAGRAAGFRTAWVGAYRCDTCPARYGAGDPDLVAPDPLRAVISILTGTQKTETKREAHVPVP